MWQIIETESAIRQFKRLSLENQKRYLAAVEELSNANDPTKVGKQKHGKLRHCYACEIGKSIRLLYTVNWESKTIDLLRVGTHKEVYGKD